MKKRLIRVKLWIILMMVSLIFFVVSIISNVVTDNYETVINIALGTSSSKVVTDKNDTTDTEYFKSAYASNDEAEAASKAVAERITEEGAVLLKNKDESLPISNNSKVTLFGHSSVNLIVCGTGSADIDDSEAVDFKTALEEKTNVEVNEALWDYYESKLSNGEYLTNPEKGDMSIRNSEGNKGTYTVNEIPWTELPAEAKLGQSSGNSYTDAAIVVISRIGGEMYDLPADPAHQGNADETVNGSGNSLELTIQERQLLKEINDSGKFSKTIVLINSANALECDFVDDEQYGVDACMWIGYTGIVGLYGVSDLLVGNENPSGKLVDTYCVDNTTSPVHVNIYGNTWSNLDELKAKGSYKFYDLGLDGNTYYNVYQEGIYVGYRYYETRYEDYVLNQGNAGKYNYATDVKYPFGYGLSYTTFDYSNYEVIVNEDSFDVNVTVTNTGATAGKEVVQVYFQSPYTDYDKQYGIEKAAIELCGFAKTNKIEPGKSETVTINVPKKELRTYDAHVEKTYIIEAGDYYFTVGNGAHDALNNILVAKNADQSRMTGTGNSNLVFKWSNAQLDKRYSISNDGEEDYEITNQFDNGDLNKYPGAAQEITYLTRSDWEGTFPKQALAIALTDEMYNDMTGIVKYEIQETNREMPLMGQSGSLTLAQMIGKDYDDPMWDQLLNQVTYGEMAALIGVGYHGTKEVVSVAKPATVDENGPQGFTKKLTDLFGNSSPVCAYTDENIMAATYNVDFMYEVGQAIGEDGLSLNIVGLYGPAMNTHRSPYSGRNFEYYSEDGFLAGKIAAAEVAGIQSKGIYVYLKHFALNDSETKCRCYSIFANEQTIREIYLEPFEKAVIEGGAMNVMNSFGRIGVVWTGAHKGLMTNVLRNEWGMKGFALTDYSTTGNTYDVKLGVMAGTDSWDASSKTWEQKLLNWQSKNDVELTWAMREATKRILYTVCNSAAMNGVSPTSRIVKVTPWWKMAIYGLIGVSGVAFVGCGTMTTLGIIQRIKKKKEDQEEQI